MQPKAATYGSIFSYSVTEIAFLYEVQKQQVIHSFFCDACEEQTLYLSWNLMWFEAASD